MDRADVFVLLDTVQFEKNDWQNRNRIKTAQGWQWLTVPVHYRFGQRIWEVQINGRVNWGRKHRQALRTNYSGAPYWRSHRTFFEEAFSKAWDRLVDLNVYMIQYLKDALGIGTELRMASDMEETSEEPNQRLVDLCCQVGADIYLAGAGGRSYMDGLVFQRGSIHVVFQDYQCPRYPQRFGEFEPNLSVVDVLFNCGPDALGIIRSGGSETLVSW